MLNTQVSKCSETAYIQFDGENENCM